MKRAVLALVVFLIPAPVFAASETTVGLWLFFLLYVVGFVFAILLLIIFAEKGRKK